MPQPTNQFLFSNPARDVMTSNQIWLRTVSDIISWDQLYNTSASCHLLLQSGKCYWIVITTTLFAELMELSIWRNAKVSHFFANAFFWSAIIINAMKSGPHKEAVSTAACVSEYWEAAVLFQNDGLLSLVQVNGLYLHHCMWTFLLQR